MTGRVLSILLVEDNPDHAELILQSLEDQQQTTDIRHVTDGQMALDYIFRKGNFTDPAKSPSPNLIILDLRLPKVDGIEVLARIKESPDFRHLPVVVLSSSDSTRDIEAAYNKHVNSYLVKPLDFREFDEMLGAVRTYWLRWNQHPWN